MKRTLGMTVAIVLLVGGVAWADPGKTATPLSVTGIREREVALGDLVADAIQDAAKADAALVSAAQFRTGDDIPAGKVAMEKVDALLGDPGRIWVVVSVRGSSLKTALERSLTRAPQASAHFLQVAGIKVTYDRAGGQGSRVKSLKIKNAAVQPETKYKIAMPEDLAKGASGYFTIPDFDGKSIIKEGGSMSSAISAYLDKKGTVDYTKLDRIMGQG